MSFLDLSSFKIQKIELLLTFLTIVITKLFNCIKLFYLQLLKPIDKLSRWLFTPCDGF
jgi:hypothetical protein